MKKIFKFILIIFLLMNVVAIFHSYRFTHFSTTAAPKTKNPEQLSFTQKLNALCFGVNNPRPINQTLPTTKYETIQLQSNKKIECWYVPFSQSIDSAKGTIIIFHGFSGQKASMLDKAKLFDAMQYNCLLVDFMGSGGSEGSITTIGFHEAKQVRTAYDFIKAKGEKNIYLFGTSMGAAAIMKCMADEPLQPKGILLECPFGTMYVAARFRNMNVPVFPMAHLLVFWGGVQNNFWAYKHNPTDYAASIQCPTLLMYGADDKNVSRQETESIFANLGGAKTKVIFENTGHENYLVNNKPQWTNEVTRFLQTGGQ
jgi:uncharacterized protein